MRKPEDVTKQLTAKLVIILEVLNIDTEKIKIF